MLKPQLIDWGKDEDDKFVKLAEYSDHLLEIDEDDEDEGPIISKTSLWGYQNQKKTNYFKFKFKSLCAYNKIKSLFHSNHKNTLSEYEMDEFYEEWSSFKDYQDKYEYLKDFAFKKRIPDKCLKWITKLGKQGLPFSFAKGKLFEITDPILRFAHLKGLKMASWLSISDSESSIISDPDYKETTCDIEIQTTYDSLSPIICDDLCPLIKEMAFDIESYSVDGSFPDPRIPQNYVNQKKT